MGQASYIIEIGEGYWAIAKVIAVTRTPGAAWEALGQQERGCVIETEGSTWIACQVIDLKSTREAARVAAGGAAFESRLHNEREDARIAAALGKLFAAGQARFERGKQDEQWFAI